MSASRATPTHAARVIGAPRGLLGLALGFAACLTWACTETPDSFPLCVYSAPCPEIDAADDGDGATDDAMDDADVSAGNPDADATALPQEAARDSGTATQ